MRLELYKLLHYLPPEMAHDLTVQGMQIAGKFFGPGLPVRTEPATIFGLNFENRVGLAAGLDKNGLAVDGFARLGFGHLEIGTVTPEPQSGNQKPRLFRLKRDNAIINRFGFNNDGAKSIERRLRKVSFKGILGVNIGKNKATDNISAVDDYLKCMEILGPVADYLVINISSPNTVKLRELSSGKFLSSMLSQILSFRKNIKNRKNEFLPILIKLSPDESDKHFRETVSTCLNAPVDGLILTNTTMTRYPSLTSTHNKEKGGLSGMPLAALSISRLRAVIDHFGCNTPIISVGGIMSDLAAKQRLDMGASLVQIYSGLIYSGPRLVKSILATC